MSSVFIAFCFVKTISGNDKFLTGTAVYRANSTEDEFRELTYKGFTGNSETLIIDFEKNSILSLIQTIPLSSPQHDSTCAPEDLPYAFSLLLYTAPAVTNSYKFNDTIGRQSFMLSKKLYNPVTSQKGIESDVIVSYTNANGRYDSLKDSLKKSVISAVGRLKLNSNSKIPHIISSEIEWSYAANDPKSSNQSSAEKTKSKEFNDQLDLIEEQYNTMTSQTSNKRRRVGLFSSSSKSSTDKLQNVDLKELAEQIRNTAPEPQNPPNESSDKN
ncbi:5427_t:CDS:2 [Dentiscutata erythropus]|uniref:5427_t:CDS:1 n=1 Tax=Dentiscutata erythropus TaxID=1348616 RepID=A0A9N9IFP6_9GLOM|nr:5427_t:CDS:2 [Dentiscutata erythropus]